jgi:hypothetical protein
MAYFQKQSLGIKRPLYIWDVDEKHDWRYMDKEEQRFVIRHFLMKG